MLVFMEGFDTYTGGSLSQSQVRGRWVSWHGSAPGTISSPGRGGVGRYYRSEDGIFGSGFVQSAPFVVTGNTVFVGINVLWNGNSGTLLRIMDGGTTMFTLNVSSTGLLTSTGGLSTIAGLQINTWAHVALKIVLDNAAGSVEARINGVDAGGGKAGVDTIAGGTEPDGIALFSHGGTLEGVGVDDLVVQDGSGTVQNDWIDPSVIRTKLPTADHSVELTPQGAPTNAEAVDDSSPDEDATYNQALAAGLTDLFDHAGDLDGTIIAVGVVARMKDADASAIAARAAIESNGVAAVGPTIGLSAGYTYVWGNFPTDPDGDLPWTLGRANALKFGYESV